MLDPDKHYLDKGPGAAPVEEPPMAGKKKKRTAYPEDYKREVVKRALEARSSGSESVEDIAKHLKLGSTPKNGGQLIYNWIKAAGKATPKPGGKKVRKAGKRATRAPAVGGSTDNLLGKALEQIQLAAKTLEEVKAAHRRLFGGGA